MGIRQQVMLSMMVTLFAVGVGFAADSRPDVVAELVRKVEAGEPFDSSALKKMQPAVLLGELKPLMSHGNEKVRQHAISWTYIVIDRATERKDRVEGIHALLSVAATKKGSENANAFRVLLLVAREQDFDAANSAMLVQMLTGNPSSDAVLLAGIVHSDAMIAALKKLPVEGWTGIRVRMALARAGDSESSAAYLKEYRELPLDNRWARIEHLSYMRTPEALGLLREYLSSSEEIPTKGDMIGAKLSHMALIELRKFVKELPSGENGSPSGVTEKDIKNAIQWLKEHPNPEIIK